MVKDLEAKAKTVNSGQNKATSAQVRLFRALFAEAGIRLPSSRLRRFKAMTVGRASVAIQEAKVELDAFQLSSYVAPTGRSTAKQLAYFVNLSRRLGHSLNDEDIDCLKILTAAEMQQANNDMMQMLQNRNDDKGVPLPAWRLERGLYDSERLRAGQQAAAARQAAKRAETDRRIIDRQQTNPRRAEKWPTSGGKY